MNSLEVCTSHNIRDLLRDKFSHIIFRRVKTVYTQNLEKVYYVTANDKIEMDADMISVLTPEKKENHLQYEYKSFSGITTTKNIRSNDKYAYEVIHFSSDTFSELDIENGTFEFVQAPTKIPPRQQRYINEKFVYSDLICGIVDSRNKELHYTHWFICSEQFLRMWTAIMYSDHQIFHTSNFVPSSVDKEDFENKLYNRLMSGNRLCTNSFRKWIMILGEDSQETQELFQVLRTEKISIQWCHVYAALVLIARYGELPTSDPKEHNIPFTHDGIGYRPMTHEWDLPPKFVDNILSLIDDTQ
jgi:hypothetical protein